MMVRDESGGGKRRRQCRSSPFDPALLERVMTDTDPTRPGRAMEATCQAVKKKILPPPPIAVNASMRLLPRIRAGIMARYYACVNAMIKFLPPEKNAMIKFRHPIDVHHRSRDAHRSRSCSDSEVIEFNKISTRY
jgi:hypothetical protein